MGQTSSVEAKAEPDLLAQSYTAILEATSRFERLSLQKHVKAIGSDADKLFAVLGIQQFAGAPILLQMARKLTEDHLEKYLLVAIGWFDGKLPSALGIGIDEWHRTLFRAACTADLDGEPYISYNELCDLVLILLSAVQWDPKDFSREEIVPLSSTRAVESILREVKTPIIQFDAFNSQVLAKCPYLLQPLANIWDRLLYDKETMVPVVPQPALSSKIQSEILAKDNNSNTALLYLVMGPKLFSSLRLYQGTTDGFAMRAFEYGVTKWPSPSILLIRGKQPRHYEKNWVAKHLEIDEVLRQAYDVPLRDSAAAHGGAAVSFALYVDEPWKVSYKKTFGGQRCQLIQLEPEFNVWQLDPHCVFLTPSRGLGAGLSHPPQTNERGRGNILFVDSALEHAVFRHLPDVGSKFEHRFFVRQVEVLGCGTKRDQLEQRKAWEWEEREAQRRRNVNIDEDRALLEMAGLIGQHQ